MATSRIVFISLLLAALVISFHFSNDGRTETETGLEDIVVSAQASEPASVCHDGVWEFAEFCGYDAYQTTGIGEMNHDCFENLMDLQLFAYDYNKPWPDLSGDLDGDGSCDLVDFLYFAQGWQDSVPGCVRSGMLPDTLQGSIALSFSPDPTSIIPVDTLGIGIDTVYVMIDGHGDLGCVEYTVETSSNLEILAHWREYPSPFWGHELLANDPDGHHSYKATIPTSPVPQGPVNIGSLILSHTDDASGWIHLIDFQPAGWAMCYLRWNNVAANRTYYFADVSHAEILSTLVGIESGNTPGPTGFALHQNIPNPFNPTTTISFAIPERTHVTLSVHDVEGRLIRTLVDKTLSDGLNEVIWDGTDAKGNSVSSGVYLYCLRAGETVLTKKMVLLK